MPRHNEVYNVPLGKGVALTPITDPQFPAPREMRGLVPWDEGRLYSFGGSADVGVEVNLDGLEVHSYDNNGLMAFGSVDAAGTYKLLRGELSVPAMVITAGNIVGHYEGAGIMAPKNSTDLDYLLYTTLGAGEFVSSSGSNWSAALSAGTAGSLTEVSGDDVRVSVVTLRCYATDAGLIAVGAEFDTIVLDASAGENSATVTITAADAKPAIYVVYTLFIDGAGEATPWLLADSRQGAGTITLSDIPIGETLPDGEGGYLLLPKGGSSVIQHANRMFAISGYYTTLGVPGGIVATPPSHVRSLGSITTLQPGRSVVYGAGLTVANMGSTFGYFTPQLNASQSITALASSPAGLLVFGDNETLIGRGNPDSTDFTLVPLSTTVGCDAGVTPARLGGLVFVIHKGRVYGISLGPGTEGLTDSIVDLSAQMVPPYQVYPTGHVNEGEPVNPGFSRVWSDFRLQQLVAQRHNDAETVQLYRYDLHSKAWFSDPVGASMPENDLTINDFVFQPYQDGLRYHLLNPSNRVPFIVTGVNGASFRLRYEDIDMGDKRQRKLYRRVHVYGRGLDAADPTGGNSSAPTVPVLTWQKDDDSVFGTALGTLVESGHWVFDFGVGVVANALNLTIEGTLFIGAQNLTAYLDSPITIEYVPRYFKAGMGGEIE